jgi:hypothetical protein
MASKQLLPLLPANMDGDVPAFQCRVFGIYQVKPIEGFGLAQKTGSACIGKSCLPGIRLGDCIGSDYGRIRGKGLECPLLIAKG